MKDELVWVSKHGGWRIIKRTYPDGSYELLPGKYAPQKHGGPRFVSYDACGGCPAYVKKQLVRLW